MRILGTQDLRQLVREIGVDRLLHDLQQRLAADYARWPGFAKTPRHATQFPHGVIELMPCSDQRYYTFKFVNGHPRNTRQGLPTVIAFGVLAEVEHGMPQMLVDMSLLTALRTAANAALGAGYLARTDSRVMGIIGCGAQAEFQVLAMHAQFGLHEIRYYDIDPAAMHRLADNLQSWSLPMVPCESVTELLEACDLLVTATAARRHVALFDSTAIAPGTHIHALGGDCPGKTELAPGLLRKAKVVVEYLPQSRREGEVQTLADARIHAELWQLVTGQRPGREHREEITLFDSVGFALQDFSALTLVYELVNERDLGTESDLLALPRDPKDLYGMFFS